MPLSGAKLLTPHNAVPRWPIGPWATALAQRMAAPDFGNDINGYCLTMNNAALVMVHLRGYRHADELCLSQLQTLSQRLKRHPSRAVAIGLAQAWLNLMRLRLRTDPGWFRARAEIFARKWVISVDGGNVCADISQDASPLLGDMRLRDWMTGFLYREIIGASAQVPSVADLAPHFYHKGNLLSRSVRAEDLWWRRQSLRALPHDIHSTIQPLYHARAFGLSVDDAGSFATFIATAIKTGPRGRHLAELATDLLFELSAHGHDVPVWLDDMVERFLEEVADEPSSIRYRNWRGRPRPTDGESLYLGDHQGEAETIMSRFRTELARARHDDGAT